LISIHSAEENEFIRTYVVKQPSSSTRVWIGLKQRFSQGFRWIDKTPFDYINWSSGEPSNSGAGEPYAEMLIDNYGMWNDQSDCNHCNNAFICQINYNNK
jgi:hypothetical protein